MIRLDHVTKLYGIVLGLNDVCLELGPGGYGLIGPNGSGKTTLLQLLLGMLRPTLGTVRVFERDPRRNKQLVRRIGYCPAIDGLYGSVSAWHWLRYLLELHGISRRESARRAEVVLTRVGMEAAMHRPMSTYSRGMRQRVKLAQAVAHDPEILVLDEPFNGLDPIARHDMAQWLRTWLADGKSLILASHVLHEVESVTSSFLLICGGRLLASGSAQEVHEMLSGVPHEVQVRCQPRQRLASLILERGLADAIHMGTAPDAMTVSTRTPVAMFQCLPEWTASHGIRISRLESSDDSLQALFDKLIRIHRGEL